MSSFPIKETVEELLVLEQKHPVMVKRLRWLRALKTNPNAGIQPLVNTIGATEFEMDRWAALYRFGGIELLISSKTILSTSAAQAKTFSDHAQDMLRELYTSHKEQLGRQLWIDFDNCRNNKPSKTDCIRFEDYKDFDKQFKDWRRTDCQTYIQDVIRYSYEKTGRRNIYDGLLKFYKTNGVTGTVMAQYLVKQGWKAYLFMPDTEQPSDGKAEHTQKYREALRTSSWWKVPLAGFIVNYKPTSSAGIDATPLSLDGKRKLAALANVKFAAGVFTKGLHTGILSEGNILEVHWKNISPQSEVDAKYQGFQTYDSGKLYESTNLLDFSWIEGIFVIPPDSTVSLA